MSAEALVGQDRIVVWLTAFRAAVDDNAAYLTELDSAIGDADHGTNLQRGMTAVIGAVQGADFDSIQALLKKVGMTLVSTVGGASGPLYGTFFLRFAGSTAGKSELDVDDLGDALRAGADGVAARGKAQAGDKTMLDAWLPACAAYDAARQQGLPAALEAAATAAAAGRDATLPLVARKGRASYLGERSAGHLDPGAASTALLIEAAAATLPAQAEA